MFGTEERVEIEAGHQGWKNSMGRERRNGLSQRSGKLKKSCLRLEMKERGRGERGYDWRRD